MSAASYRKAVDTMKKKKIQTGMLQKYMVTFAKTNT